MDDIEPERRSIFLRGAVFLANAFLILFAVDSAVSLLDSAVLHLPTDSALYLLRIALSLFLLAFFLIAILLLIFVPHLPKIVLLPPVATLLWLTIGAPPLQWSMEDHASMVPMNAIALGVAALSFVLSKLTTGAWLLDASRLPHKSNLVMRTLVVAPVFLVVVFVSLAGLLVVGVGALIEQETKGYLNFSLQGVEVRETVMRKGDKRVHLVAMVHFGEPRFYRELYAGIPPQAVILAEGISDRKGVLRSGLDYSNAARALGLDSQAVFEQLLREGAGESTPSRPAPPSSKSAAQPAPAPRKPAPTLVRADVDASEFSPTTLKFLQAVGEVYGSATLQEAIDKLSKVGNEFTDADIKLVWDDILYKRNTRVLSELDKQLPNYQVVYIPWGAQHMPDLETGLRDRGFTVESSRLILLARYDTILGGLTR